MIASTSRNRTRIKEYLESIDEDTFIARIIIPLFNSCGYQTYRINAHSAGEHGKDIVFYRYSKLFHDFEYIVVQAKAERVTTSNVADFVNQLKRAISVPIQGLTSSNQYKANYAIFIDSKSATNDAFIEMIHLADNCNIKFIYQENMIELIMMDSDIIPEELLNDLEVYGDESDSDIDNMVRKILFHNDPNQVSLMFDSILSISRENISIDTKKLVIEYVFKTWQEDNTWDGTVKPMKWLDKFFDFIQPSQYHYLAMVVGEKASSTPSYAASYYTQSVFKKITKEQFEAIKKEYYFYAFSNYRYTRSNDEIIQRLLEWTSPDLSSDQEEREIYEKLNRFYQLCSQVNRNTEEKTEINELEVFFYRKSTLVCNSNIE